MSKYTSRNCFRNIAWQSVYIEKVKVENNNLHLTFEDLLIEKEHPLNPFDTVWERMKQYQFFMTSTNPKTIQRLRYGLQVFSNSVFKVNYFTIVTKDIKEKNKSFFEQTFEGFSWNFGEDTWDFDLNEWK